MLSVVLLLLSVLPWVELWVGSHFGWIDRMLPYGAGEPWPRIQVIAACGATVIPLSTLMGFLQDGDRVFGNISGTERQLAVSLFGIMVCVAVALFHVMLPFFMLFLIATIMGTYLFIHFDRCLSGNFFFQFPFRKAFSTPHHMNQISATIATRRCWLSLLFMSSVIFCNAVLIFRMVPGKTRLYLNTKFMCCFI